MNSKEKQFINTEKILAVILSIAGLALLFMAQSTEPVGEIDTSVLVAYGEVMAFVGTILGVDYSLQKFLHSKHRKDEADTKKDSI